MAGQPLRIKGRRFEAAALKLDRDIGPGGDPSGLQIRRMGSKVVL